MLTNDDVYFVLDSLNDRLENLTDLNTGDFDMVGDFDEDIAQCESLITYFQTTLK
jgi:hypothetical protein